MGLETVNNDGNARLHQLDTANPTGTDNKNQGDDHIRNIKKAIKDQFSGISGDNSSGAVTATAAELNKLDGCTASTSNLNSLTGIDNIVSTVINTIYPVGSIYESTVGTNPNTLFAGTSWSVFASGKMLVGIDSTDTDFATAGLSDGSKTVTLTEGQMPQHNHPLNFSLGEGGGHSHDDDFAISSAGEHKHGTNLRLEGAANGNILIDNSLYYATGVAGREIDELSDWNAAGDSTYTMNAGSHSHDLTGGVSAVGNHTHGFTGSISNTGSSEAHDNMPPYTVVYRWKRDS
jgi:microcystin-dependent protein